MRAKSQINDGAMSSKINKIIGALTKQCPPD